MSPSLGDRIDSSPAALDGERAVDRDRGRSLLPAGSHLAVSSLEPPPLIVIGSASDVPA